MATKTIAVEARVYERLAATKHDGESFSKAIDRLLETAGAAHTGSDILRHLGEVHPLTDDDAEAFFRVVEENRETERWAARDLR